MPKQNWAEREQTKAVSIKSGLLTPWSVGRPVFLLAKITKLRKTCNYWCMLQCCMHKHRWLTCLLVKIPAERVEPRVPLVGLLLRQLAAHPDHVAEPSHRPFRRHLAGAVLENKYDTCTIVNSDRFSGIIGTLFRRSPSQQGDSEIADEAKLRQFLVVDTGRCKQKSVEKLSQLSPIWPLWS